MPITAQKNLYKSGRTDLNSEAIHTKAGKILQFQCKFMVAKIRPIREDDERYRHLTHGKVQTNITTISGTIGT